MESVNNFINLITRAAMAGKIKNPSDISFMLDMYYITDRTPPTEFKEFAFDFLNNAQLSNGFWRFKEYHYVPDTARTLLTYKRENEVPPYAISGEYYQSINTWQKVVEDINIYDPDTFWGGLWGYISIWLVKGESPPWLTEYVNIAEESFDAWKLHNHDRNHVVGTFSQIYNDVLRQDDLIAAILNDQNPEDGGWGATFVGSKSSSIETSASLITLGLLGYNNIDEVVEKSTNGIIAQTYKTDVVDEIEVAGWSYYPEEERMDIHSTAIVLLMLVDRGIIAGNNDPYYIAIPVKVTFIANPPANLYIDGVLKGT